MDSIRFINEQCNLKYFGHKNLYKFVQNTVDSHDKHWISFILFSS